jgi:hypothetical protein
MASARKKKDVGSGGTTRASDARKPNPQLRLSCPDVSANQLPDRTRHSATGRWLFVFDSPKLPLRHVSWRRRHVDHDDARQDLEATVDAVRRTFGDPTRVSEAPAQGAKFKLLTPYKWEWRFADIRVEVSALHYGRRGVDVLEAVEVPWPIRPDAPTLPP